MKRKHRLAKAKRITLQQKKRTSRRKRFARAYEVLSTPRPLPVYRCPVSAQIDREILEHMVKNTKLSVEAPKGTPIRTISSSNTGIEPVYATMSQLKQRRQAYREAYTSGLATTTEPTFTCDQKALGDQQRVLAEPIVAEPAEPIVAVGIEGNRELEAELDGSIYHEVDMEIAADCLRMAADQQIRSQLHKSEYTIHVDTAAPGTTDHSAYGELTVIPDIHQNHRFTGFYYAYRSQEVPPVADNLNELGRTDEK